MRADRADQACLCSLPGSSHAFCTHTRRYAGYRSRREAGTRRIMTWHRLLGAVSNIDCDGWMAAQLACRPAHTTAGRAGRIRSSWVRYRPQSSTGKDACQPLQAAINAASLQAVVAMAVAMLPANLVARAKQFADEQLAVYAHLISENESLDDALALGVLTSREATLAQPVQRLAMCRDRCLCLELGQALMTKGLHTAAIDVLRTAGA